MFAKNSENVNKNYNLSFIFVAHPAEVVDKAFVNEKYF